MSDYHINVFWSAEDNAWVAVLLAFSPPVDSDRPAISPPITVPIQPPPVPTAE